MTFLNTRWQQAKPPPADHTARLEGVHPLITQILFNRGITEPDAVRAFLKPSAAQPGDPFLMSGMEAAVKRIERAIQAGERIAVYGDYDADGVTGTVLLTQALRAMGATRVQPYIPNRMDEGYGLNEKALDKLAADGNHMIITVDCGVRAVGPVHHANRIGLDVIITDHHTSGPEPPPAVAVIDPKQPGDAYPDDMLAGVGVAFKLVQALIQAGMPLNDLEEEDLLDLVALGTVADLVPLLDENRLFVQRGLEVINQAKRPGLAALMKTSGAKPGRVTATTIGFTLGPRINAAGRMAHAYQAARLLIADESAKAEEMARKLETLNQARQEVTREMTTVAEQLALEQGKDPWLIVAAHSDFPSGIAGLIASRLAEKYYRPAIVVELRDERSVGSCRSIPEFHITEALDQSEDLLVRHGGHAAAAGFTVRTDKLDVLQDRLTAIAQERLSDRLLMPTLYIDAELSLNDLAFLQGRNVLERLEPCGYGNPPPLLLSSNVRVLYPRTVGRENSHLKFTLKEGKKNFDAIAFRMGDKLGQMQERMDIVYHLEENEWNGRVDLQLNVQDMRPAGEE